MRRLDPTVRDLLTGAFIYGIIVEIIGLVFVENRLSYSLGILVGFICVVFLISNMYITLEKALDMEPHTASKYSIRNNILRYLAVVAIAILVAWVPQVSVIAMVIMIFGMKISAFLQPQVNKYITSKIFKERR